MPPPSESKTARSKGRRLPRRRRFERDSRPTRSRRKKSRRSQKPKAKGASLSGPRDTKRRESNAANKTSANRARIVRQVTVQVPAWMHTRRIGVRQKETVRQMLDREFPALGSWALWLMKNKISDKALAENLSKDVMHLFPPGIKAGDYYESTQKAASRSRGKQ